MKGETSPDGSPPTEEEPALSYYTPMSQLHITGEQKDPYHLTWTKKWKTRTQRKFRWASKRIIVTKRGPGNGGRFVGERCSRHLWCLCCGAVRYRGRAAELRQHRGDQGLSMFTKKRSRRPVVTRQRTFSCRVNVASSQRGSRDPHKSMRNSGGCVFVEVRRSQLA
eukprot:IDg1524t1